MIDTPPTLMSIFLLFFLLIAPLLGLAFISKRRRERVPSFELVPNCLLTRWPVLFVTGRRSLFYYSNYWNTYPAFLAEHGYEVFHLHLPWRNTDQRIKHLRYFLKKQSDVGRKFHFLLDQPSLAELQNVLINSPVVKTFQSVPAAAQNPPLAADLCAAFTLHRWLSGGTGHVPAAADLGLSPASLQNAVLLLEQVRTLAEEDIHRED